MVFHFESWRGKKKAANSCRKFGKMTLFRSKVMAEQTGIASFSASGQSVKKVVSFHPENPSRLAGGVRGMEK